VDQNLPSVTLVHKGNIMKFTEGSFAKWGYELAEREFGDKIITEKRLWDEFDGKMPAGKILIKDRIADSIFQQIQTRPDEYSVLALPNLNGDYLSDAAIALAGGLGLGPGANMSDEVGLFEATHGTAPKYTGMDKVNPGSLILSAVMMLDHMQWNEAADLIVKNLDFPGAEEIARRLRKLAVAQGIAEPLEGDPQPQPDPQQVLELEKAKADAKKAQGDVMKMALELEQTEVETEGKELDNAQKALELSIQSGQLRGVVNEEVSRVILGMIGPQNQA